MYIFQLDGTGSWINVRMYIKWKFVWWEVDHSCVYIEESGSNSMQSECMGMEEMWLHFILSHLKRFPVCVRQIRRVTILFHFLTIFPSQFLAGFFVSSCLPSVCGDSFCFWSFHKFHFLKLFSFTFYIYFCHQCSKYVAIHAGYFNSSR